MDADSDRYRTPDDISFMNITSDPKDNYDHYSVHQGELNKLIDELREKAKTYKENNNITDLDFQVDFTLKQALARHVMSQADKQIAGILDNLEENGSDNLNRLAYVLLPQLQLANDLERKARILEQLAKNPEIDRCINNIKSIQSHIVNDMEPYALKFIRMMFQGPGPEATQAMQEATQHGNITDLGMGMGMGMYYYGGGKRRGRSRKRASSRKARSKKPRKMQTHVIGF